MFKYCHVSPKIFMVHWPWYCTTNNHSIDHSSIFEGHKSILVGPLISFLWTSGDVCPRFKSYCGFLTCILCCLHAIPQIHFWCGTYWPYRPQHGIPAFWSTYLCWQALVEVQGSNTWLNFLSDEDMSWIQYLTAGTWEPSKTKTFLVFVLNRLFCKSCEQILPYHLWIALWHKWFNARCKGLLCKCMTFVRGK